LALEPDSFKRAKIQIILTIITFSVIKAILVTLVAFEYQQYRQFFRALVIVVLLSGLAKVILYRPSSAPVISHILLIAGLIVIWSNLLIYVQYINIFTVQLIFMTTLVSYYLIGGRRAACYTVFAIFPVLYYFITKHLGIGHIAISPQELVPTGGDPVIALNFLTFVAIHYLYYRAFHQNLREKEILNEQLQKNITEVKALAESRSVFLSTMSHELRTPLNGVIGMVHLLKDTALEEQKDKLDILDFSANNLLSVINDVLDYNKSELDKIELEALPVNLPVLLRQIHSGLKIKASEKGLNLVLDIDTGLENARVITDPTRITQIIYNLAGNAIKFTDEGAVKITLKLISNKNDKIHIRFSISDTGIGIAAERHETIFDPFTQASSDTTRKFGGTGLGLAIVKRLIKLFGSTIQLESRLGEGSEFSFSIEFPVCGEEVHIENDSTTETADLKGLKLLIVEDNRINVLLLEKLLSKWQIETAVAGNGQEALDKLLTATFDGILMDIHMPVMDGYTAATAIRALTDPLKANIPIIAITASVSNQLYAKIRKVGMQDYINKPFQPDQLSKKLSQVFKMVH